MKRFLLYFLLGSVCLAQSDRLPSATLTAKSGAVSKNSANYFKTDYGSYDKDIVRNTRIDVEASTIGRAQITAVLRWLIIGKPLVPPMKRVVLSWGEEFVKIAPGSATKLQVHSGDINASDMNLVTLGDRETSGHKLDGWVLRLVMPDGREIAAASSNPETLSWARDQDRWLQKPNLAELLKEEKSHPGTANLPVAEIEDLIASRDAPPPSAPAVKAVAAATPRSTEEAQKLALTKFPDLGRQGSPLNARFVAKVQELRASNPQYFTAVDWPLKLAEELAK